MDNERGLFVRARLSIEKMGAETIATYNIRLSFARTTLPSQFGQHHVLRGKRRKRQGKAIVHKRAQVSGCHSSVDIKTGTIGQGSSPVY